MDLNIIIFDIECTTWKGAKYRNWSGAGEHREVVQIAAVLIETKEFTELSVFQSIVKPKINPVVSDFFINLTNITQERVNKGVKFTTMLQKFHQWCKDYQIYSFDSRTNTSQLFDRDVLKENCSLLKVEFPFENNRFHNINKVFLDNGFRLRQSGATPEAFGIKIPARPHNALNDVRGLIIGLKELKRLGKI